MSYRVSSGRSRYDMLVMSFMLSSGVSIMRKSSALLSAYAFFQNVGPSNVSTFFFLAGMINTWCQTGSFKSWLRRKNGTRR